MEEFCIKVVQAISDKTNYKKSLDESKKKKLFSSWKCAKDMMVNEAKSLLSLDLSSQVGDRQWANLMSDSDRNYY